MLKCTKSPLKLYELVLKYNYTRNSYNGGVGMSTVKKITCKMVAAVMAFVLTLGSSMSYSKKTHAVEETELKAMAEEIIWLVNEARMAEGLLPLKAVPYLCDVAQVRARECIFEFSHWRSSEHTDENLFISAVDVNLVPYSCAAENIAAGSSTAEATFNQWKGSPGHWKSIMNPKYTHIGVGVGYEPDSEYKYYWEQLFIGVDGELQGEYVTERYKTVPKGSGDINGDSSINSFDLITINKYLANEALLNDLQIESADTLKDGYITSADAVVLRKYILGDYHTLPMTMDMLLSG
jgi:uncharacterized protein YkwD